MIAVKPALEEEQSTADAVAAITSIMEAAPRQYSAAPAPVLSPKIRPVPAPVQAPKENGFQPRIPVITGEATYRGSAEVHGTIAGQLGGHTGMLAIKQRPRNGSDEPELDGEISFKDMLRINGHIAGKVFSQKGTLIVDTSAKVEAAIDVRICVVSGMVVGDIIGHERVEVGSGAIVKGNIATRTLSIKPGAVFQGDCRMLKDESE
jgi:cytoskeletal protein CcmA (bactofilin family)